MFESLHFSLLRFTIRPVERLLLPEYKGSTFRGAFGKVFKRTVCLQPRGTPCETCYLQSGCSYYQVFETPIDEQRVDPAVLDVTDLRGVRFAPHPFIIEPPLETKREYTRDEALSFNLILIGKAVDYFPYFIFVVQEMGRQGIGKGNGHYRLEYATTVDANGYEHLLFDGCRQQILIEMPPLSLHAMPVPMVPSEHLWVEFLTPTRLQVKGKLTMDIQFVNIIRALVRRLVPLQYFHCTQTTEHNLQEITDELIRQSCAVRRLQNKLQWYDWSRWSNRKQEKMLMGGFRGEITFEGNFAPFADLLRLGAMLHVGKGAVFGMGKYQWNNGSM